MYQSERLISDFLLSFNLWFFFQLLNNSEITKVKLCDRFRGEMPLKELQTTQQHPKYDKELQLHRNFICTLPPTKSNSLMLRWIFVNRILGLFWFKFSSNKKGNKVFKNNVAWNKETQPSRKRRKSVSTQSNLGRRVGWMDEPIKHQTEETGVSHWQ